jgi:hypothetical protein
MVFSPSRFTLKSGCDVGLCGFAAQTNITAPHFMLKDFSERTTKRRLQKFISGWVLNLKENDDAYHRSGWSRENGLHSRAISGWGLAGR